MVLSIPALLGGGVNAKFHTQKYKLLVSIPPFNQLFNHRDKPRQSSQLTCIHTGVRRAAQCFGV